MCYIPSTCDSGYSSPNTSPNTSPLGSPQTSSYSSPYIQKEDVEAPPTFAFNHGVVNAPGDLFRVSKTHLGDDSFKIEVVPGSRISKATVIPEAVVPDAQRWDEQVIRAQFEQYQKLAHHAVWKTAQIRSADVPSSQNQSPVRKMREYSPEELRRRSMLTNQWQQQVRHAIGRR